MPPTTNVFTQSAALAPASAAAAQPVAGPIAEAKKLNGSLYVCVGPSGCGKTEVAMRLSVTMGYFAGKPWYGYDANGDVVVALLGMERLHYHAAVLLRDMPETFVASRDRDAMVSRLEREGGDVAKLKAEFLRKLPADWAAGRSRNELLRRHTLRAQYVRKCREPSHLYDGVDNLERLTNDVASWVRAGVKEAREGKLKEPRAIVYVDEAGSVRDADDKFWPRMRMARNAGLTLWSTGHRIMDWHPATRAIRRVALLWKPTDRQFWDFDSVKIRGKDCADHQSGQYTYIVGGEPTLHHWNSETEKTPAALIVPAQPSVSRAVGLFGV